MGETRNTTEVAGRERYPNFIFIFSQFHNEVVGWLQFFQEKFFLRSVLRVWPRTLFLRSVLRVWPRTLFLRSVLRVWPRTLFLALVSLDS